MRSLTTGRWLSSVTTSLLAATIAFVAHALPAHADEVTDALLGLVRQDAALVLEAPKVEEQVERIRNSDFYKRILASELYSKWIESDRFQSLLKSRDSIERSTNRSFAQLRREVFGNGLVAALFRTGETKYAGLILAEAESAKVLEDAISAWNMSEQQDTTTSSHAGQEYFRRDRIRPNKSADTLYYAKFGRTFVLTESLELLKPVLELQSQRVGNAEAPAVVPVSILKSSSFRKSRTALQRKPFVAAYINPRDWDSAFPVTETSNEIEKGIGKFWRRLETLALTVNLDEGPVIETHAFFNNQNLPPMWSATIDRMQGPAEFLNRIPADAVIAFAGIHDGAQLARAVAGAVSADMDPAQWDTFRQVGRGLLLGRDLFDDVLPAFGPNVGGYAVARQADKPMIVDEVPLEGLIAFNIPNLTANSTENASIRDALDNALNTGLNLAAAHANSTQTKSPAIVRSDVGGGTILRWIEDLAGYRPAYALSSENLVISTTPEMVRKFMELKPAEFERTSHFGRVLTRYFPDENQVSFVDVKALRKLLESREQSLIESAVAAKSLSAEESAKRMKRLIDVANLVDSAFLAGHVGSDHFRLIFGSVTDPPAEASAPTSR